MPKSITVDDFSRQVIGLAMPRQGFVLFAGYLYKDGVNLGLVKEMIDESDNAGPMHGPATTLRRKRGPYTFIFADD